MITQNIISINTVFDKNIRKVTELELVKFLESQKGMNPIESAITAKKELNTIENKFMQALLKKGVSDIKNEIFNVNLENNNINQMIQYNNENPIKSSISISKSKIDNSFNEAYDKIIKFNEEQKILKFAKKVKDSRGFEIAKDFITLFFSPKNDIKIEMNDSSYLFIKFSMDLYYMGKEAKREYFEENNINSNREYVGHIKKLTNQEVKSMLNFMKMSYEYNHSNKSDNFIKRSKKMFKFLNYVTVDLYKNEAGYFVESPQYEYIKSKVGSDFHNLPEDKKMEKVEELTNSKEFMKIANNLSQILSYENKCKIEKKKEKEELVKKIIEVKILEETEEYKQNLKKLEEEMRQSMELARQKAVQPKTIKKLSPKETKRRAKIRKQNRLGMRLVPDNYALRMK